MDIQVKKSINSAFTALRLDNNHAEERLIEVIEGEGPFLEKVKKLDQVVDDFADLENFREIFFDLLIFNFFTEDAQKLEEDYLDSPEWEEIEERTIDRGTELLNVFLYLRECKDEGIEASLDDYLKEFLLVEDSEFQDEHAIYESVIANQVLIDSDYSEIAKVAGGMSENDELHDIFYAFMSFFLNPKPNREDKEEFEKNALNKTFDKALYNIIVSFNN